MEAQARRGPEQAARSGYARYVGRVGGLAVALGVGMAIASAHGAGAAHADTDAGSTTSSTESSKPASDSASDSGDTAGSGDASGRSGDGADPDTGAEAQTDDAQTDEAQTDDTETDDTETDVEADVDNDTEDDDTVKDDGTEDDDTVAGADGAYDGDAAEDPEQVRPDASDPAADDEPIVTDPASEPEPTGVTTTSDVRSDRRAAAVDRGADDASPAAASTMTSTALVPMAAPDAPAAPAPDVWTILAGFLRDMQRTFFNWAPDARNQRVRLELADPADVTDPLALVARDRDEDALNYRLLNGFGPRHGSVTFDQASGTFVYDPDDAFARTGGTDTFTYKVSDASAGFHLPNLVSVFTKLDFGHADLATVTITLAPAVKSGIDLSGIDDTVRPGDDFFGWLHGKWLKEHVIPSDRGSDGASWAVQDQISRQLEQLIAELSSSGAAHGTDEQRIADLFASFMDTETIERVGVKPLLDELAGIRSAPTADALAAVLGGMYGVDTGFDTSVEIDSKNPTRYVLALSQAGLGLPDEAYYRDPQYVDILAAYPGHIAAMLALVYGGSADDYAQTAQRIVTLETRLASAHWDAVKNRDPELTYNPRAFSDLAHEAPGFDWDGWLVSFGVTREQVDDIVVKQPDFLTAFAAAWSSEPLQDWKDWATWQTIHARAQLLTEDLVAEDFAFYSKRIAGKEQLAERRERALRVVGQRLGYAVGERYVQKHFPPEAKQRIQELVDNLIAAYRDSITHLEWMTEETRAKALEKLDMMTVKVGYPEQWRDYFGVDIQRDDLYGNVLRATVDLTAQTLAKLGQPVDRSEWDMTPQTVNAYYERSRNEIVFPAGMLQGVFFDPQADDAMNYGGIGAVIGHEIGHAFDDTGSRYDGAGRLVEWWTEADRAAFDVRTKALVEQYNQYVPRQLKDGPHVNGALTLGENIADLGGLAIALQAYQKSLGGKEAPVIDGYTGVQRVLLAYAQSWKEKAVDADMLSQLATDVHSPAEFRVNGVLRNIDAFYEAFGVGESDALYLSPDQRVRIWT